jgi:hypothetical protein
MLTQHNVGASLTTSKLRCASTSCASKSSRRCFHVEPALRVDLELALRVDVELALRVDLELARAGAARPG